MDEVVYMVKQLDVFRDIVKKYSLKGDNELIEEFRQEHYEYVSLGNEIIVRLMRQGHTEDNETWKQVEKLLQELESISEDFKKAVAEKLLSL